MPYHITIYGHVCPDQSQRAHRDDVSGLLGRGHSGAGHRSEQQHDTVHSHRGLR